MTDPKQGVDPEALKAGHETAEVSARPVTLFLVGLTIGIAVVFLAMLGLFRLLADMEDKASPKLTALEAGRAGQLPPEPRLQVLPREHFMEYKAEQNRILNTYGWVDRDSALVRLPIEKAMHIAVERGFPAREGRMIEPTLRMKEPNPAVEPVPGHGAGEETAPGHEAGGGSGGHH